MCKTKELTLLSRIGHGKQADLEGKEENLNRRSNVKKSKLLIKISKRKHQNKNLKEKNTHNLILDCKNEFNDFYSEMFAKQELATV